MKKPQSRFLITAVILAFCALSVTGKAFSEHSKFPLKYIAGHWVIVQLGIVPSNGLMFAGQLIPAGASIASTTLWRFDSNGTCKRKGFVNFDGTGGELSVPLSKCKISLNPDGTGMIEVESPLAGPSVVRIIVVNKDEIAMISSDSAIVAATFKRQKIRKGRNKHNHNDPD